MSNKEQETLLQTIRARLKWNEKGSVSMIPDKNGPFNIVKSRTSSGLVKYFEPSWVEGFDKYGAPIPPKQIEGENEP